MDEDSVAFLKDKVAEALINTRGYHIGKHKGITLPESESSVIYKDAGIAVETFIELLLELNIPDSEYEENETTPPLYEFESHTFTSGADESENEPQTRDHSAPMQNPSVVVSNATSIFLDPGEGESSRVGDVRDWLYFVDSLGIPDSTKIEGRLFLTRTTDVPSFIENQDGNLIVGKGEVRYD